MRIDGEMRDPFPLSLPAIRFGGLQEGEKPKHKNKGGKKMSITLFEKTVGDLSGEIRMDKYSNLYHVLICYYGKTIYRNTFDSMKNARSALARNMKKFG